MTVRAEQRWRRPMKCAYSKHSLAPWIAAATIAGVRKALVLIMLLLLPIQFVWGAATGYCQHETRTADTHFGHHVHEHQAKLATRLKDSAEVDRSIGGDHLDCPSCHLTSVSAVLYQVPLMAGSQADLLPVADEQPHRSFLRHRIERPNWRRAA
jgi:hypothetical protein